MATLQFPAAQLAYCYVNGSIRGHMNMQSRGRGGHFRTHALILQDFLPRLASVLVAVLVLGNGGTAAGLHLWN
jgi:hypothetical protein